MQNKKLGFGFMRMPLTDPSDQKSVDIPQVKKMADLFLDKGFTYLDTAWMYHDFTSEDVVGRVVTDRHPRESFTIASKMPCMMLKSSGQVKQIFNRQKKKLHVDYFDYYLMHDIGHSSYEKAKKYDAER